MKIAVIDLGTNTFHLMLAEVSADTYEILHRERKAVKIGEKGISKGEITAEAWDRALIALQKFKAFTEKENVEKIFATATSAIRNARNGAEMVAAIKETTGIEIEVISGMREAELIYLGAKKAMDFGPDKKLIMDIGGGSIEFIIADQEKAHWMHSFEIGGQRLVEHFHKSDPITEDEIQQLDSYFEKELGLLFSACEKHQPNTLVGCSGTFDTLSDIYCTSNSIPQTAEASELPFSLAAFKDIYLELIKKTKAERLLIPGMIEMRVEMIVVACILVEFLTHRLNLNSIRVSAYALKEGILFNVLDRLQKMKREQADK